MSEMDELLAQLKAEYEQKEQAKQPTTPPAQTQSQPQKASPLDQLLAQVKSEFEEQATAKPQRQPISSTNSTSAPQINTPKADNLLQELQAEFQAKEQEGEQRRQQQHLEEQRLQQARQQRKRQALKLKAQEWLKQLDPKSDEGRWFEEFSYSYESKLEAAIDYLQALREAHASD